MFTFRKKSIHVYGRSAAKKKGKKKKKKSPPPPTAVEAQARRIRTAYNGCTAVAAPAKGN
jgi:hypothetical protein